MIIPTHAIFDDVYSVVLRLSFEFDVEIPDDSEFSFLDIFLSII